MIDIISFLEASGIDYRPDGDNVAKGDVNACCPFCRETNFHMGIDIETTVLNCWVCGLDIEPRPRLVDFVSEFLEISKSEAWEKLRQFDILPGESYRSDKKKKEKVKRPYESVFPEGTQSFDRPRSESQRNLALAYLEGRGFGWREIDKYNLKFCTMDLYRYRIIVPFYFMGRMVGYTARDYMGREDVPRYLQCKKELTAMPNESMLYGYDFYVASGNRNLRLVEGPTDLWRMGDSVVAALKNRLSQKQLNLIVGLKPETVSIFFDLGSYSRAYKVADELSLFINKIKVVRMPSEKEDVGACSFPRVLELESATAFRRF